MGKKIIYILVFIISLFIARDGYYTYIADPVEEVVMAEEPVILNSRAVDSQVAFSYDLGRLLLYAEEMGYQITMGETWRTRYQQRHNIDIGVSWTYNSKHLVRRAVDLNLIIDGRLANDCSDYEALGDYWESLSPYNKWGGRWRNKDCPHFQRSR